MANPFKEAEKAKKVAPGGNKPPVVVEKPEEKVAPVVTEAPVEPVKPEVAPEASVTQAPVAVQPKAEKKPAKAANKIDALLGPAQKAKKQERSTVAVYLSKENQTWLKETAENRGISTSALLDQILTQLRDIRG